MTAFAVSSTNGAERTGVSNFEPPGPKIAARMIEDGRFATEVENRYAKWNEPKNKAMRDGKESLSDIAARVHKERIEPQPSSGRQEYLENLLNAYL